MKRFELCGGSPRRATADRRFRAVPMRGRFRWMLPFCRRGELDGEAWPVWKPFERPGAIQVPTGIETPSLQSAANIRRDPLRKQEFREIFIFRGNVTKSRLVTRSFPHSKSRENPRSEMSRNAETAPEHGGGLCQLRARTSSTYPGTHSCARTSWSVTSLGTGASSATPAGQEGTRSGAAASSEVRSGIGCREMTPVIHPS